jgi:hypothetical protein
MRAPTPAELAQRRDRLKALAREVDDELTAIEGALGMHGAARSGRPRLPNLLTEDEMLDCRRRWRAGERSAYVTEGKRQYERTQQRKSRREATR